MIRFIQSYAAPDSIGNSVIFKMVLKHFNDKAKPIPFYAKTERLLSSKECREFGFANYDDAKDGDILFGLGGRHCAIFMVEK